GARGWEAAAAGGVGGCWMRAWGVLACRRGAVSPRLGHGELVPLGPCGPIDRPHEAIELAAIRLRRLGGTSLARLGMVAYRHGVAVPIPFQIDERIGSMIAMAGGPEPSSDDRPGVLDPDDELVFMACDAGERAPGGTPAAALGREIRIDDPLDHHVGWAYLMVADSPPHTDRRYVEYEAAHDGVEAAHYRVGMVGALPAEFRIGLGGPLGPNLIDGLRLRAEATLHTGLAHWSISERDGHHGPVPCPGSPARWLPRPR